ncbi:MAG: prepilin peptidase [Lachnospiraceae bacterium]
MLKGLMILAFFWGILFKIALFDWKYQKILNRDILLLLGISLLSMSLFSEPETADRVRGAVCAGLPMMVISMFRQGSFGGGDIKLSFVCGIFLGTDAVLKAMAGAVFSAGIYAVWLLIRKDAVRNTQFAFGPFLCLGMFAVTCFI